MKTRKLYFLLPAALLGQLVLGTSGIVYAELVFLMVIFAGIFLPIGEAVKFSIIAAFLRGFFTAELLLADMVLFPLFAALSGLATEFFYREDVFLQALLGVILTGMLILTGGFFLKVLHASPVNLLALLVNNWPVILLSGVLAPFIFYLLKKVVIAQ